MFGIAKLNGTNWPVWELRVEAHLATEDLWEVVMEEVPEADKRNAEWKIRDRKAKEDIVALLEESQLPLVKGKVHARDVFCALKEHHQEVIQSVDHTQRGKARKCFRCGQPGHFKRSCPKLGGLGGESGRVSEKDAASNTKKKLAGRTATVSMEETATAAIGTAAALTAVTTEDQTAESDNQDVAFTVGGKKSASWVIDSGASAHMCSDRSFFTSLREFAGGHITLANGKQTEIRGEGSGVVYGVDGNEEPMKIDMGEVKFVPGLATNLISVGKLVEKKFRVVFGRDSCSILDAEGEVVVTGRRHGGLYYLRLAEEEESMVAADGQHNMDCQHQWHRRLGHRDWAAAERIFKEELATGMKVTDCGQRLVCECCEEGKSNHLPPVIDRKAAQVVDVVHVNLCGPMGTVTPSGNRFVVTIVDGFSQFTVTYLVKHKTQAVSRIKRYVSWVEDLFGRKPRVVSLDGGGELNSRELRNFSKAEGIRTRYTTASKCLAGRKSQSLVEMANCMLNDGNLDKRFWGEAMLTANYLQNRMPSGSVQSAPYELWWKRKPALRHLRVFSCPAYVNGTEERLIFVGYAIGQKAYRFVDPETDEITVSRNARFVELGDGSTTVELTKSRQVEEILLKPFVEKQEEPPEEEVKQEAKEEDAGDQSGDSSDDEEFHEAEGDEGEPSSSLRRSSRSNLGTRPRYLDDFKVEYAVGIAACAVGEAVGIAACAVEEAAGRSEELKTVGSRWIDRMRRFIQG